jgi:N-glycosylase/DNA lyase
MIWRQRVADYNLPATLSSGQTFCWRSDHGRDSWQGWVGSHHVRVRLVSRQEWEIESEAPKVEIERYFGWRHSLPEVVATFPKDPWMTKATAFCPGLRLLHQDPWETTVGFICSALKQIVQIQQINQMLRESLGDADAKGNHRFPNPRVVAESGEAKLRRCRLGFRARHLAVAARQIASGDVSLESIAKLPTEAARAELLKLQGVGPKIANCILLFAYGRWEAFPIDIWIARALAALYFPRRHRMPDQELRAFAASYFGPNAGYAQQYLFHWYRLNRGK